MARNTSTTERPRGPLTRLGILSMALSLVVAFSGVTSAFAGDGHEKSGKSGGDSEQHDGHESDDSSDSSGSGSKDKDDHSSDSSSSESKDKGDHSSDSSSSESKDKGDHSSDSSGSGSKDKDDHSSDGSSSGSKDKDDHSSDSHGSDTPGNPGGGGAPAPVVTSTGTAVLKPAHVGATNPGFGTGSCPTPPVAGYWGWHFVLQGNNTEFVTVHAWFASGYDTTTFISQPTGKHAYVFTPTADTLLGATAAVTGTAPLDTEFNLSHVCAGAAPVVLDSTPTPTTTPTPTSTPGTSSSTPTPTPTSTATPTATGTPTSQSTPSNTPTTTTTTTTTTNPPSNPPLVISNNPPAGNPPAVNPPANNPPASNKPGVDKPVDPIDTTAGVKSPGPLAIPGVPVTGNTILHAAESGGGLPALGLLLTGIGAAAMVVSRKKARR